MSTVLTFDELGVGQQVSLSTNDRGAISGVAVDAALPGTGVSIGFIDVGAGNQTFSGSAGPNQLSTITTLRRNIAGVAGVVWNFLPTAVTKGSLVHFIIDGFNAGTLTIRNNGADLVTLDTTDPAEPTNPTDVPFPTLVFDGTNWALVRSRIVLT